MFLFVLQLIASWVPCQIREQGATLWMYVSVHHHSLVCTFQVSGISRGQAKSFTCEWGRSHCSIVIKGMARIFISKENPNGALSVLTKCLCEVNVHCSQTYADMTCWRMLLLLPA